MDEYNQEGTRIFSAEKSNDYTVQSKRKLCTLLVNWQSRRKQDQLLLQTVLTEQSAWHDPLYCPREWVNVGI